MTRRSTTAPNGATAEQFEQFVAGLQAEGRGAHGTFALIDPEGNDLSGISIDLLCLDDRGREFHGFYSTMTYDTEPGVMTAKDVLSDFWPGCLAAAWSEQDSQDARDD